MKPQIEKREADHLLGPFEARVLPRMARALPSKVLPDHLTLLALISAIGIGLSYGFSSRSPLFLWLASIGLVLHWFGDSLDGTLARVRKTERPRYGFYLDHITDAFSTLFIGLGLGFSPYLHLSIALVFLIVYYLLFINVFLETHVLGIFRMGYGRIGTTEIRLLMILCNTVLAIGLPFQFRILGVGLGPLDIFGLVLALGMGVIFLGRMVGDLRTLSRLDPLKKK